MSAPQIQIVLDGDLRIDRVGRVVRVWHRRSAHNVSELEQVLALIEEELVAADTDRLLFDSRESAYTAGAVQTKMWTWLQESEHLSRVATLVNSPMLATSVNMSGLSKHIRIRGFHSEAEAMSWLQL